MKLVYSMKEITAQKKRDQVEKQRLWAQMAEEAGGGERGQRVADAMRTYYSMFDDKLIDWSAHLYDKGHGAYYTCTVGRDTEGYLPDVESTVQMLRWLDTSGILRDVGGTWRKALPEWMLHQMVYYAKSLQDENGFFYYPSWAKETADEMISRRARDVGWCTSLLTELGEKPMYDAPNGTKGGGSDPDEYWASLNTDEEAPRGAKALYEAKKKELASISKEAAEAAKARASASTAYLRSHTAFVDYLDTRLIPGMRMNPYFYGNEVGETYQQVREWTKALGKYEYKEEDGERYRVFDGMTLSDILIHELDAGINPDTGLWGDVTPSRPTGKEFLFTNGFMKGMAAYNGLKYPYPAKYLKTVANTLMDSLLGDEPSTGNVCEVYNTWVSVCRLRDNLQYVDDEAIKAEVMKSINDILIDKAPEAILNSFEKIKGYKTFDGGMSHSYYLGTPDHQGMPISTSEREKVADVDATCIASGVTTNMFSALGLTKVPLFMTADYMRYINILENLRPVVKTKLQNPLIDFEDPSGRTKTAYVKGGAVASIKQHNGSKAMRVDFGGKDQTMAISYSAHAWDGEYYLFDGEITVDAPDGARYTLEYCNAKLQTPVFYSLSVCDGELFIENEEMGLSKVKIGEVKVPFSLRTEYTNSENESYLDIFVDGEKVGQLINKDPSDTSHPAGYPARAIRTMQFRAETEGKSTVYYDNLVFYYAKRN
ncbi:MAG: hypothetical protein IJY69_01645 [Clostridia bacterium]|nr:hypothetical protein [Clostridia bacterium]